MFIICQIIKLLLRYVSEIYVLAVFYTLCMLRRFFKFTMLRSFNRPFYFHVSYPFAIKSGTARSASNL